MVFNIVVPSLETVLDRHVMIQATLTFKSKVSIEISMVLNQMVKMIMDGG